MFRVFGLLKFNKRYLVAGLKRTLKWYIYREFNHLLLTYILEELTSAYTYTGLLAPIPV